MSKSVEAYEISSGGDWYSARQTATKFSRLYFESGKDPNVVIAFHAGGTGEYSDVNPDEVNVFQNWFFSIYVEKSAADAVKFVENANLGEDDAQIDDAQVSANLFDPSVRGFVEDDEDPFIVYFVTTADEIWNRTRYVATAAQKSVSEYIESMEAPESKADDVDGWFIVKPGTKLKSGQVIGFKNSNELDKLGFYSNNVATDQLADESFSFLLTKRAENAGTAKKLFGLYEIKNSVIAYASYSDAVSVHGSEVEYVGARAMGPKHEFYEGTISQLQNVTDLSYFIPHAKLNSAPAKSVYAAAAIRGGLEKGLREGWLERAQDKKYEKRAEIDDYDGAMRDRIRAARKDDDSIDKLVRAFWSGEHYSVSSKSTPYSKVVMCPAGWVISASSLTSTKKSGK